eukprot:43196-Amphidinium_carterae.1
MSAFRETRTGLFNRKQDSCIHPPDVNALSLKEACIFAFDFKSSIMHPFRTKLEPRVGQEEFARLDLLFSRNSIQRLVAFPSDYLTLIDIALFDALQPEYSQAMRNYTT